MADFLQQLINGVSVGAVYALIAVGFSLVYGVLNLVNFAHGDVLMAASFLAVAMYGIWDLPLALAVIVGIAAGAVFAMLVELLAARPVRVAPRLIPMITTFGAALIFRSFVQATAGSGTKSFSTPLSGKSVEFLGLRITWITIATIVVTLVVVTAFGAYLKYFKSGYGIRAAAQDLDTSALMGIPINRTILVMFAVGGAIGVVGGLLYAAQIQAVYPSFGFAILLKGFVAAILGGIGNLKGAVIGGLILGVVEGLTGPYISTAYLDAIAFGLLIVVLLLKPNGLLGAQVQERV